MAQSKDVRLVTEAKLDVSNAGLKAGVAADLAPIKNDVADLKVLGGLNPGSVNDATAANLIETVGTETHTALSATIDESVSEAVTVQSKIRSGGDQKSIMLSPNPQDGIADLVECSVILNPGNTLGMNNVIGGDGSQTVGTDTPNVVGDGTIKANISVIGGYDNVAGALSSKIISDHSYTAVPEPGVGHGHNGIFGGQGHVAGPRSGHAGMIGGDRNTIDSYSSLVGGLQNTIEGNYSIAAGNSNHVKRSGNNSAVFGTRNVAEGLNSLMGGLDNSTGPLVRGGLVAGENNTVLGYCGVATGQDHMMNADYSTAGGRGAEVNTPYEDAYGAGGFNSVVGAGEVEAGSAQRSTIVISKETTNGTATNMPATPPVGSSWVFEAYMVAVDVATQDTAAWRLSGVLKNTIAGVATLFDTSDVTLMGADVGASAWTVILTNDWAVTGKLVIRVQGEAGKTIRWVTTLNVTQVKIPVA